jgi:hypothetical protein
MDKDKLNISAIETFFNGLLDGNVSNNTFFGGLPAAIQSTWSDMVVVDCSTSISDMNAYGSGVVSILLYPAKNRPDGSKDTATCSRLAKALNVAIKNNTSKDYQIKRMGMTSGYDTARKLYHDVVFVRISIY